MRSIITFKSHRSPGSVGNSGRCKVSLCFKALSPDTDQFNNVPLKMVTLVKSWLFSSLNMLYLEVVSYLQTYQKRCGPKGSILKYC